MKISDSTILLKHLQGAGVEPFVRQLSRSEPKTTTKLLHAKLLSDSKEFVFEFTPFQSNPASAHFNVQGLDALLEKVAVPCGWGKAQERLSKQQKDEERKARELQHLRQWRLHVDVASIEYNSVTVHSSSDQGPESEILLSAGKSKHIDANEHVKLEIERPVLPSMLRVTVNGKVWPASGWTTVKDPRWTTEFGAK